MLLILPVSVLYLKGVVLVAHEQLLGGHAQPFVPLHIRVVAQQKLGPIGFAETFFYDFCKKFFVNLPFLVPTDQ